MEIAIDSVKLVQSSCFSWIVVLTLLTAFELLNPQAAQSLRDRANGVAFWAVSIPLGAVMLVLWQHLWTALGLHPLLTLPFFEHLHWSGALAGVIAVIAGAIVNDFFFYWFHRAQHRFLWRYHAVHHSIRDLSAVNSYHHASEALIGLALHTIPASLVLVTTGPVLPLLGLALWLQIVWIHSPTRANFGPLRFGFVDNRYHRLHHSLQERHFNKNFGAFTTLWDRLFGTHMMPAKDEWPEVGLAEMAEPQGVVEWITFPVRYSKAQSTDPVTAP